MGPYFPAELPDELFNGQCSACSVLEFAQSQVRSFRLSGVLRRGLILRPEPPGLASGANALSTDAMRGHSGSPQMVITARCRWDRTATTDTGTISRDDSGLRPAQQSRLQEGLYDAMVEPSAWSRPAKTCGEQKRSGKARGLALAFIQYLWGKCIKTALLRE